MVEDRVDRGPRRGRCVRSRRTLRPLAQGCAERPDPPGRARGARRRSPTGARSSAESTLAIEGLAATNDRLWVLDMDGGVSGLRAFELDGTPLPPVELPAVCAIDEIVYAGDDRVAYPVETFVEPRAWWVAVDEEASPRRTALTTLDAPRSVGARGSAHVRDVEGRDAHPHQPDRAPRCARRRPGAHAVDRLRRIRPLVQGRGSSRVACSGSSGASYSASRTSAAAASTATPGIRRAGSSPSRTASTTSPPALDIWSRPASPPSTGSRSSVGRTAGC